MSEFVFYTERTKAGSVKSKRFHRVQYTAGDVVITQCGKSWDMSSDDAELRTTRAEVEKRLRCRQCFKEEFGWT